MARTRNGPVIDEVRAIRHAISARFDHDPYRLRAHWRELEEQGIERLFGVVGAAGVAPEPKSASPSHSLMTKRGQSQPFFLTCHNPLLGP